MYTDDVTIETEDGEGSTGTAEQKLKVLRDKLKAAQVEAGENLAGWQRSKADYVNLSKRMREIEESLSRTGIISVVGAFTDVFDSVEASEHEVILKQLDTALVRLGVTRVRPDVGSVFNPNEQEAVQGVATEDKARDNTIHTVLQSGYALNGITIRPARVTVFHHG